jgi:hypothetical protein
MAIFNSYVKLPEGKKMVLFHVAFLPQKCRFYGETSCAFLHGLTWLKPTKNWDPTQQ